MSRRRVNHILVYKAPRAGQVQISLPINLIEELDTPVEISIHEYPFRLALVNLRTQKSYRITRKGAGGHITSYTPVTNPEELLGRYLYTVDDDTVYLEKET